MKKKLIIIFGLFFVLISLGFASAETCYVTTYNSCIGNGHNVVMRLSADTNAHGEVASGSYSFVLCCDFGDGGTGCYGDNTIIRLSSETNAHAEARNLISPVYNYEVCYDNLKYCGYIASTNNCAVDEIEVLYLSDYANAHLGASGYSTKICCEFIPPAEEPCILTSGVWSEDEIIEGTNVNMNLTGNESCEGANINFSIYDENNDFKTSMTGVFPTKTWTSERFGGEGDYENRTYFFKATVIGPEESQVESTLLTVLPDINCSVYKNPFCSSYESQQLCVADPCNFAELNDGYNPSLCGCEWDGLGCDYACQGIDSETGEGVGKCLYSNQIVNNTCEEDPVGFLTFTWDGIWIWDENCDDQCRIDNVDKKDACEKGGSKTIECPAQILLPFFGIYSMIISVLAIAMVYVVLGILKKKKIRIRFTIGS